MSQKSRGGILALFKLISKSTILPGAVKIAAEKYKPVVTFPPITLKNRALRHVFFVDFDNGVTRDGVCKFYGISKIVVKDN